MTSVSVSTSTPVAQLYVGDSDGSYVDYGYISSGEYTWNTAVFSWNSASGGLSWATAKLTCWIVSVAEVFALTEAASRKPGKRLSESFGVYDALPIKAFRKNSIESLNLAESYSDSIAFILRFFETLALDESIAKRATKPFASSFGIAETDFAKRFGLNPEEFLSVVEAFGRLAAFKLALSEGFGVTDAYGLASKVQIHESLKLLEEYIRSANGTISDILIDTGDLTLDEFTKIVTAGHAPGFSDFKDYIHGDYEFQHAIIRTILESTKDDRAVLNDLKIDMDVPDVFDRGSVIITTETAATGVYISFNREFHIAPEITMTLKGGTIVAIPKSLNPTSTGFTAILIDPATGNGIAGSLTWAAHGY